MKSGGLSAGLLVALGGACIVSLLVGPAHLSAGQVLGALGGGGDETTRIIVRELRLPRTLLALLIGAGLAAAGAALQGLTRNPLAAPDLLGTSGFAAAGAVAAIYFGASASTSLIVPVAAIGAALLASALVVALAGGDARLGSLILAGLALSSLSGALIALALSLAPSPYAVAEIAFWLLGSLADRSPAHLALAAPPIALGLALVLAERRALTALALGEDVAATLGVALAATRLRLLIGVSLIVGGAVAVAGVVGFVGLVVPHLVRPLVGNDPGRALLPSALAGATLLTLADCLVRLIPATAELKLGVVTALIGVPFFMVLLMRERRGAGSFL